MSMIIQARQLSNISVKLSIVGWTYQHIRTLFYIPDQHFIRKQTRTFFVSVSNTHTYTNTHTQTHTHTHAHTHTQISTHTFKYTHTHTCTYAHKELFLSHTHTHLLTHSFGNKGKGIYTVHKSNVISFSNCRGNSFSLSLKIFL